MLNKNKILREVLNSRGGAAICLHDFRNIKDTMLLFNSYPQALKTMSKDRLSIELDTYKLDASFRPSNLLVIAKGLILLEFLENNQIDLGSPQYVERNKLQRVLERRIYLDGSSI